MSKPEEGLINQQPTVPGKRVSKQTIFLGVNDNPKNTGVSRDTGKESVVGLKSIFLGVNDDPKDTEVSRDTGKESVVHGSRGQNPRPVKDQPGASVPKKEGATAASAPVTPKESTSRVLIRPSLLSVRTPTSTETFETTGVATSLLATPRPTNRHITNISEITPAKQILARLQQISPRLQRLHDSISSPDDERPSTSSAQHRRPSHRDSGLSDSFSIYREANRDSTLDDNSPSLETILSPVREESDEVATINEEVATAYEEDDDEGRSSSNEEEHEEEDPTRGTSSSGSNDDPDEPSDNDDHNRDRSTSEDDELQFHLSQSEDDMDRPARAYKEPPTFSAKKGEDGMEWIDRYEQVATYNNWNGAKLLASVVMFTEGAARTWVERLKKKNNFL